MANADNVIEVSDDKPTNLSMKRGSNDSMEMKWAIPLHLMSSDYYGRTISFVDCAWSFNASKDMEKRWQEVRDGLGTELADRLWIRDLGTSARSHTQDFDRDAYHPVTNGRYLDSVTGWVMINGTNGGSSSIDYALYSNCNSSVTYGFGKPNAPVWGEPTFDNDTNKASCTFTNVDDVWIGDGLDHERFDTLVIVERRDNVRDAYRERTGIYLDKFTDASEEIETAAITDTDGLAYDQWIDIHFWAQARGLKGDSPWAHAMYTIAHPPRATVEGVTVSGQVVTVRYSSNENAYHPIDAVELQRLANTTIWTKAAAKQVPDNSWTTVTSTTDGTCTGLTDGLSNAQPSRDHYTWYRIKTTRCSYTEYSDPFRARELEKLGTAIDNDEVHIISVTKQEDGTSLKVVLAWTWYGDERDDSNGTEVSWSPHADAWQSTEPPSTYDLDDSRGDSTPQVTGYTASASLVIRGLEEGTPYYIKARRYQDNGDNRIYSLVYSTAADATYPIAPSSEETAVHLSAPQYVKRGEGAALSWSFDVESEQKSWNLYRVTLSGTTITSRLLVASGDDQVGSYTVPYEQAGGGDKASFLVSLTTGGEWSDSNVATVTFADPPELDATVAATLTSQPMSFSLGCDNASADVIAKVVSLGVTAYLPDGEDVQAMGDVIWSARISPEWAAAAQNASQPYAATVTLPKGLPFRDGARYALVCSAIDADSGFQSDETADEFAVNWARKAQPPATTTTVTPNLAERSATIVPAKPSNWATGDVYDLYRVTNDSVDIIAEGQVYGMSATDRYAPFSNRLGLMYRVCNRTPDGSVEWADFVYDMPVGVLRFDWGESSVELPYNISLQDSYEKNYEAHQHLDGSVSGHWNPGYKKTGTYSTDLIKITEAEKAKAVRDMATYAGPVFVRTADGGAFEANVSIGMDTQYSSGAVGISLNVEGHTLSDVFRLSPEDFAEEA